jgi:two-component system copper resistance phosphate regulon response regulator CusR
MHEQTRLLEANDVAAVAATADARAPRILVIDSDALHRMTICRAVSNAGYIPAGAPTYEEAAKLAQAGMFDCVMLDLSLGAHAGAEMLRHLWVLGCRAPILLVGDTAAGEALRVAKSLDLDVGDPVAKPVDMGLLRYRLEQLRIQRSLARGIAALSA